MPKLKLDLEAVAVESFATTREPVGPRGTVRAREDPSIGCLTENTDCRTMFVVCPSRIVSECNCFENTFQNC